MVRGMSAEAQWPVPSGQYTMSLLSLGHQVQYLSAYKGQPITWIPPLRVGGGTNSDSPRPGDMSARYRQGVVAPL